MREWKMQEWKKREHFQSPLYTGVAHTSFVSKSHNSRTSAKCQTSRDECMMTVIAGLLFKHDTLVGVRFQLRRIRCRAHVLRPNSTTTAYRIRRRFCLLNSVVPGGVCDSETLRTLLYWNWDCTKKTLAGWGARGRQDTRAVCQQGTGTLKTQSQRQPSDKEQKRNPCR